MKICVIMSTYNGEKYINQQLDSIFRMREIMKLSCMCEMMAQRIERLNI